MRTITGYGKSDLASNSATCIVPAAWGARLSETSTTDNTATWGADDQSGTMYGTTAKWLNVRSVSPFQSVQRTIETAHAGDDEVINFGAEIGSSKIQPTGTYSVNVVMTATTL